MSWSAFWDQTTLTKIWELYSWRYFHSMKCTQWKDHVACKIVCFRHQRFGFKIQLIISVFMVLIILRILLKPYCKMFPSPTMILRLFLMDTISKIRILNAFWYHLLQGPIAMYLWKYPFLNPSCYFFFLLYGI